MTSPGQYAADDRSFARSAGGAASRGVMLIAGAVLLGFVLLWQGFDGGGTDAQVTATDGTGTTDDGTTDGTGTDDGTTDGTGTDDGTTDGTGTDDGTTDGTSTDDGTGTTDDSGTAGTVRPAGEVKVAVANGVGVGGLAGEVSGTLGAQGFTTAAKNTTAETVATSAIYYLEGYSEEAKVVASALGAPPGIIQLAPADVLSLVAKNEEVTDFHIFVIMGGDRLIG